jgi:hypothetical protein
MKIICNFTPLAASGFGVRQGMERALHGAFCRRLQAYAGDDAKTLLRRGGMDLTGRRRTSGDRGAVGRVLCSANRALRAGPCSGLLQSEDPRQSDGSAWEPALNRSDELRKADAGASKLRQLTGDLRACRASSSEAGSLLPRQPCMNELPSHAHNFSSRPVCRPDRLYVCPNGAGVEKLHG